MGVCKMKKVIVSLLVLTSPFLFAQGAQEAPAVAVKVFTVNSDVVKISKQYPATIKPEKSVNIIARVSGALEKRYFTEGAFVKKGQNLYTIEQSTYQANVDAARADVNRAKSLLVKATSDWRRYKKLFDQDSISASQKDEYYYNYQDAIANVRNTEAILANAKIQFSYTNIKAPMDGIVSITLLNEGNYVTANTILTTITKVNPVYVEFSLPQTDIGKYLNHIKSKEVTFSTNCQDECITGGVLKYVSPTLNDATNTLLLRTEFKNDDSKVTIGQFTDIYIDNITLPKVISIPEVAIIQKGSSSMVYVVDDNSTAQMRPVQLTGESSPTGVVLSHGLKGGEQIVVSNISKLKPNSKVKIIEEKE